MSTHLFSKKNIETQQPDSRGGLLEELNLPPNMISFIRKNERTLQVAVICIALVVLGWIFYDYYSGQQENKGAALLSTAMQMDSPEQKVQTLENVIKSYSRTNAALWSKLELGHIDYRAGRFEEAAVKFKEILEKLSSSSPLMPLVQLSLAQSYEEGGHYDQAIAQYNLLKKDAGFKRQANLAEGRILVAKGEPEKARRVYEELLQGLADTPDPALKSIIQAKLASLDEGEPISTPALLEENKK